MDRIELVGSAVNADEFNALKRNVIQLTEEISRLKVEVTGIISILNKTQSNHDSIDDITEIDQNHSNQSLENNVGDSDHTSMLSGLDDSALFDNSVISARNSSNEKSSSDDAYTMEFIEVDVVNQTSESLLSAEIEKTIGDDSQIDEIEKTSGTNIDDSKNENGCNGTGLHQILSNDTVVIETDKLNGEMMFVDARCDVTNPKRIGDCVADISIDPVSASIENLPIVMKSDDADDQL